MKMLFISDIHGIPDNLEYIERIIIDKKIDKLVLIIDGLSLIYTDDLNIYLNHGHIYNKNKNKGFNKGILVYGHEHIPCIEKKDNMIYINVGSISLPRDGNDPTYMIYENKEFTIYDIYGNIVSNFRI